ncbi:hypothetical protein MMC30_007539 [Trapelia coarctata]|nr:hypothetical protein [Trapelia coarctata]
MKPSLSSPLPHLTLLHHASPLLPTCSRAFSSSPKPLARNRIYESIRSLPALTTTISLSTTSSTPLLTLFTISTTSPSTTRISTLLRQMLETEGIGEPEGGVGYAEVDLDAEDCRREDVAGMYLISAIPTLMAFSRGEPQQLTKVTDTAELLDREFLRLWIENEARRGGAGGAGGSPGFLGALFGLREK